MTQNTNQQKWMQVVAKAWGDPAYKEQLLAEPAAVLSAEGVELPPGKTVRIVEPAEDEFVLVLPRPGETDSPQSCEERLAAYFC